MRELYTRNMELYFTTRGELQFTTEAYGLKADGSEFVGEMSWGIVDTSAGPMLLAVGRDVSHRRTAEARLLAVAAMSEHAPADSRAPLPDRLIAADFTTTSPRPRSPEPSIRAASS